jgi:hypothetical protein
LWVDTFCLQSFLDCAINYYYSLIHPDLSRYMNRYCRRWIADVSLRLLNDIVIEFRQWGAGPVFNSKCFCDTWSWSSLHQAGGLRFTVFYFLILTFDLLSKGLPRRSTHQARLRLAMTHGIRLFVLPLPNLKIEHYLPSTWDMSAIEKLLRPKHSKFNIPCSTFDMLLLTPDSRLMTPD